MHHLKPLLTVSFTSGDISLMNNYDDLSPAIIRSGLKGRWAGHCARRDRVPDAWGGGGGS